MFHHENYMDVTQPRKSKVNATQRISSLHNVRPSKFTRSQLGIRNARNSTIEEEKRDENEETQRNATKRKRETIAAITTEDEITGRKTKKCSKRKKEEEEESPQDELGGENNPFSIDSDSELPNASDKSSISIDNKIELNNCRQDLIIILGRKIVTRGQNLRMNHGDICFDIEESYLDILNSYRSIHCKFSSIGQSWYCDSEILCMGFRYMDPLSGITYEWFEHNDIFNWIIFLFDKQSANAFKEYILCAFKNIRKVFHEEIDENFPFSLKDLYTSPIEHLRKELGSILQEKEEDDEEINLEEDVSEDYVPPSTVNTIQPPSARTRLKTRAQTLLRHHNLPESRIILEAYNNIRITVADLDRLREGQYLNDNIVDFWYIYLSEQLKEYKDRFHIFSTHFYPLLKKDPQRCAERVHKNEKLMDKDLIFIPICEENHWVLVVVCYPCKLFEELNEDEPLRPFIMYCDSLGNRFKTSSIRYIKSFLWKRFNKEKGTSHPELKTHQCQTKYAKLPLQENQSDCGLYVLQYVEEICKIVFQKEEKAIEIVDNENMEMKRVKLPISNRKLFSFETIQQKRLTIRDVILDMALQKNTITPQEADSFRKDLNTIIEEIEDQKKDTENLSVMYGNNMEQEDAQELQH